VNVTWHYGETLTERLNKPRLQSCSFEANCRLLKIELFDFYGNAFTVQPGLLIPLLFLDEEVGRNLSGEK